MVVLILMIVSAPCRSTRCRRRAASPGRGFTSASTRVVAFAFYRPARAVRIFTSERSDVGGPVMERATSFAEILLRASRKMQSAARSSSLGGAPRTRESPRSNVMGTGPRGGRRVREAAEAAAAAASDASRKVAAAAVVDAPPLAKKPRRPPNPSAAPTVVDPADVARKSAAILEKRGYAAAAVARACAAHAPSNDDASQPLNEQKRRFVAAASEWMLRNSELFALPKDVVEDARARREQASAGEGEHRVRRALETNPAVNDGARLSDRARRLIANGILPIEEEHLAAASASGENANANAAATAATTMTTTTRGAAGADAQDRDRTGLSLRARRLERAAARARDLCAFVATGAPCPRGDACRRLHDVDAYLTNKPADVPDRVCPHVERGLRCPHGLRCRFAGTHAEDEAAPGKVGKTTPAGDDESETFAYGF